MDKTLSHSQMCCYSFAFYFLISEASECRSEEEFNKILRISFYQYKLLSIHQPPVYVIPSHLNLVLRSIPTSLLSSFNE